jgi:hypothetical protein
LAVIERLSACFPLRLIAAEPFDFMGPDQWVGVGRAHEADGQIAKARMQAAEKLGFAGSIQAQV